MSNKDADMKPNQEQGNPSAASTEPGLTAASSEQGLTAASSEPGRTAAHGRLPARPVIGIGTDIIECDRIDQMIEKHGETFLHRVYTKDEIEYCQGRKASNQHYAGRWAAKEAALKALGTGWAHGIQWTDVEVVNQQGGRPIIVLDGKAKEISDSQGIDEMMISISHCKHYATAYATAVGFQPQ